MLNLLISILVYITPVHAAGLCEFTKAISQPGRGNKCLIALGGRIQNPVDKKAYLESLAKWKPPKGFRVSLKNGSIEIAINGKVVVAAAMMSMKPVILSWNGQILMETESSESMSESFDHLMAKRASAERGVGMPSGMETRAKKKAPAEKTAAEVFIVRAAWLVGQIRAAAFSQNEESWSDRRHL